MTEMPSLRSRKGASSVGRSRVPSAAAAYSEPNHTVSPESTAVVVIVSANTAAATAAVDRPARRGRATQRSAADESPSHCTNIEIRPRSMRNGHGLPVRTSASTNARSSAIITTAKTMRGWQKSGRKLSSRCDDSSEADAALSRSAAPALDIGRGPGSNLVDLLVAQILALAVRPLPEESAGIRVARDSLARDLAVLRALLGSELGLARRAEILGGGLALLRRGAGPRRDRGRWRRRRCDRDIDRLRIGCGRAIAVDHGAVGRDGHVDVGCPCGTGGERQRQAENEAHGHLLERGPSLARG